jgi:hypothetical protein
MSLSADHLKISLVYVLLVVPPLLFYYLLFRSLSIFPFFDDYNSVLEFLLRWKQESGLQHITEILTFQHNEYRLMFESAIFGTQYEMLGHTNLEALSALGNLFVLPLFAVLCLIWKKGTLPKNVGLISLVPVSWLLFQLQYAETLNWAMASLSNIPALLFALLCLYLAAEERSSWMFPASLISMGLSCACSGNGLLLIPVGGIMLVQRVQYKRLWTWLLTGAVICSVYFFKYNFASSRTHSDHSVLSSIKHFSLPYASAFLGAAAAERRPLPAVVLGIALMMVFVLATRAKIYIRNPALYYSALFLIVAAVAVSGLRSDGGLATSLASRYRINSALMLIFMYLYLAEKLEQVSFNRAGPKVLLSLCGIMLVAFTFISDRVGYKSLLTRRAKLDEAMVRWEGNGLGLNELPHPASSMPQLGKDESYYFEPEEPILTEAIKAGIYPKPQAGDR